MPSSRCSTSVTTDRSAVEHGRAIFAEARAEIESMPPLEWREIVPLARVPGWYAYRGPDQVTDDGRSMTEVMVLMKAHVVERKLGRLPVTRERLPAHLGD